MNTLKKELLFELEHNDYVIVDGDFIEVSAAIKNNKFIMPTKRQLQRIIKDNPNLPSGHYWSRTADVFGKYYNECHLKNDTSLFCSTPEKPSYQGYKENSGEWIVSKALAITAHFLEKMEKLGIEIDFDQKREIREIKDKS